jgi:hypothetical protein
LDPGLQDEVDSVPDLLTWQSSPQHQDRWTAAKAADAMLVRLPGWKDRPVAERLAEVARRVNSDFGAPAPTPPAPPARTLHRGAPETLSGVGGGSVPDPMHEPNYHAMTEAQILADLSRNG